MDNACASISSANPRALKQLLLQQETALLFAVSLAFNLLSGRVPITSMQRTSLRQFKSFYQRLAAPRATADEKRALIRSQPCARLAAAIKTLIRIAKCHNRALVK